jgi:DUF4097 and DUF4098 domain-containing protein YvlB
MKWMMLLCLAGSTAYADTAQLAVKGPIELRISVITADIEVSAGPAGKVTVSTGDCPCPSQLTVHADRVDVTRACGPFVDGKVTVEVPPGSSLDLDSTSGDVNVRDIGGRARVRAISGDVKIRGVSSVELTTVSGDAKLSQIKGEVRVRTVSGSAQIAQACGAAAQMRFASTSGDLEWHGDCAAGCRLETRTTSGTVKLVPGSTSSFEVSFSSRSGSLDDKLALESLPAEHAKRAKLGKGEGLVECRSISGDLTLARN